MTWKRTHGLSRTRFHRMYYNMQIRCTKPSYKMFHQYGGRGIKCLWDSFQEFADEMRNSYIEHSLLYGEENTSLDRKDNDGHYCKENCRWTTTYQQRINRRDVRFFNGETTREASLKLGGKRRMVDERLYRGWNIEKAFNTPAHL